MLMISLRIFSLLCLLLVAYLITIPVNAETEYDHPPIEIGIIADNAPYSSVESIGLRGFTIDLLDELSRLSGVQFIYRVGSWSEIYGAFLRRDIDAISEISVVFRNLCHFSSIYKTGMTHDRQIRFRCCA